LIASKFAPMSSTSYFSRIPCSWSWIAAFRAVWPPSVVGVGHDRRRVRVDEDDADALLAQDSAGLGTRVVELRGLPDDDRPGADDEDAVDVVALGH
jgi:hypothetical protein